MKEAFFTPPIVFVVKLDTKIFKGFSNEIKPQPLIILDDGKVELCAV